MPSDKAILIGEINETPEKVVVVAHNRSDIVLVKHNGEGKILAGIVHIVIGDVLDRKKREDHSIAATSF